MAMRPKPKAILLGAQLQQLQRLFPNSSGKFRRDLLCWRASIQPTPISASYLIDLTFRIKCPPKVHVVDAAWRQPGAERPPHTFSDGSLCLYYSISEFNSSMLLVKTIIPWTAEWLLHYELWLASGKRDWFGGGITHEVKVAKQ
jgi:hypothetical protein